MVDKQHRSPGLTQETASRSNGLTHFLGRVLFPAHEALGEGVEHDQSWLLTPLLDLVEQPFHIFLGPELSRFKDEERLLDIGYVVMLEPRLDPLWDACRSFRV